MCGHLGRRCTSFRRAFFQQATTINWRVTRWRLWHVFLGWRLSVRVWLCSMARCWCRSRAAVMFRHFRASGAACLRAVIRAGGRSRWRRVLRCRVVRGAGVWHSSGGVQSAGMISGVRVLWGLCAPQRSWDVLSGGFR